MGYTKHRVRSQKDDSCHLIKHQFCSKFIQLLGAIDTHKRASLLCCFTTVNIVQYRDSAFHFHRNLIMEPIGYGVHYIKLE